MNFDAFIENLNDALKDKLPGYNSQIEAAPKIRENIKDLSNLDSAKKSAVLILLYPYKEKIFIPFIKRIIDGSNHSGQIAFPGGKFEDEDENLINTAIREAEEEVGIKAEDVSVLKSLTPLYIPVSNFYVQPILGILSYRPKLVPSPDEIDRIFEIDIKELYNSEIVNKEINIKGKTIDAPFFIFGDIEIWGATAMMLNEFINIIKKVNFE